MLKRENYEKNQVIYLQFNGIACVRKY